MPNDTLLDMPFGSLSAIMAQDFRDALLWHMTRNGTTVAELSRETGVSRDVINKVRLRAGASTSVENAMLIAAFYGKSVNQFILCEDVDQVGRLKNLVELISPEVRPLVEAQIRGLLNARPGK
ncbi:helix-turn-helix transcriptional regulator [Rhodovulum sulfidophilum]|nr:helix-turn-helix transcriptional regulator [Rhodovulum sulfidophilum]MBL3567085.1 helix-turn-helix transcriptional regulator [Rhodovulum sulfidophilum]MCE8417490.1 helix-turn-helix domain-containing protein [Rhodovulum sulfidophilum]